MAKANDYMPEQLENAFRDLQAIRDNARGYIVADTDIDNQNPETKEQIILYDLETFTFQTHLIACALAASIPGTRGCYHK